MAIVNQLVKALAAFEDLLLGQGTVTQSRAGVDTVVTKLNGTHIPYSGDTATADMVSLVQQIDSIDLAKASRGNLPLSATGGTIVLTAAQFDNTSFDLTGTLVSNLTIQLPDTIAQMFVIDNATTGAFTVTVKHAATPGVLVAQGSRVILYTTGALCEDIAPSKALTAADIAFIPAGTITQTNLQLALAELDTLKLAVAAAASAFTGHVTMSAAAVVPAGYLECDGLAVSRATYATLFAKIGATFGAGDGATTFNVPDLRGEFVRGWDHGKGIDVGRGFGTFQLDAFKTHTHNVTAMSPGGGYGAFSNTHGVKAIVSTSTGGVETRPRSVALMYVIKT